jgi:hypothetical protein
MMHLHYICFKIREIASVMDEMLKASFGAELWRETRLVVFSVEMWQHFD